MIGVQMGAVDTLYFRNGAAYASAMTSTEHPGGQFPPQPATMVGAMRAALARGRGWRGGPWPAEIVKVLGDGYGPDDLGQLHFDGPYLLRCGEPIFALPAHLLGRADGEGWQPEAALRPGRPVICDLGDEVCLPTEPEISDHAVKLVPGKGQWLTRAGMATVLRGGVPERDEVIPAGKLWHNELRIGIERDDQTRTAREGMLYTSRHIRTQTGVTVGVRIEGLPQEWQDPRGMMAPLGGEGRWTECQPWNGDIGCETPLPEILASRKALLIALTPVDAGEDFYQAGTPIAGLGATIISACLPQVERVGGWATHRGETGPLPLRSILPAGSTFFCEIGDPDAFRAAVERSSRPRVGRWQSWGFGAVAIGLWPDTMEETQ